MLKLKLQYFGYLMQRVDSFEKTLLLGKIEGARRKRWQRMRWLDGITNSWIWANSGSWWWTGRPGMLQSMESQRVRHDWATELNWTELSQEPTGFHKLAVQCPHHVHTGGNLSLKNSDSCLGECLNIQQLLRVSLRKHLENPYRTMINSLIATILRECRKTWDVKKLTSSFPRQ